MGWRFFILCLILIVLLLPSHGGAATAAAEDVENELSAARAAIRRSAASRSFNASRYADNGFVPRPSVYRNPAAFFKSYEEMEKRFRVFVYEEGAPPMVHHGPCKDIYATEGRFIEQMDMLRTGMRTFDPDRANAFFLPFSVAKMVNYIFNFQKPLSNILRFVGDYVDVVADKYPFWNRTAGADHFMLACYDWGPHASRSRSELYNNSIRALCNANTSEGFRPEKDVSIPEINLSGGDIPAALQSMPTNDSAPRPYLAFFAGGGDHGPIRPVLLEHWKGRDNDLQVHEYLPKGVDYYHFVLRSKFCLCPSGHEVASPRIPEAVYAGCVPVILSQGYVLPFSDVLRWEEFSVTVAVEDIPRLKEILMAIPESEIQRMREGVRAVRRHFMFTQPPMKYDTFHMIMHSVWLRRLNLRPR